MEERDDNRRQSVPVSCKSAAGFHVNGEEGPKVGREDARHRVNLGESMKIIPSNRRTVLTIGPQNQNFESLSGFWFWHSKSILYLCQATLSLLVPRSGG